MTNAAEIDSQIQNDYNRFYSSVFDGELPHDLLERFKKALMALAPASTKYNSEAVKKIINKRANELSFIDVGLIINGIFAVPFEKIYSDIDEAIDKNIELELIREKYNKSVEDIKEKLTKKKNTLMKLSGVNNSVVFQPLKVEA